MYMKIYFKIQIIIVIYIFFGLFSHFIVLQYIGGVVGI